MLLSSSPMNRQRDLWMIQCRQHPCQIWRTTFLWFKRRRMIGRKPTWKRRVPFSLWSKRFLLDLSDIIIVQTLRKSRVISKQLSHWIYRNRSYSDVRILDASKWILREVCFIIFSSTLPIRFEYMKKNTLLARILGNHQGADNKSYWIFSFSSSQYGFSFGIILCIIGAVCCGVYAGLRRIVLTASSKKNKF